MNASVSVVVALLAGALAGFASSRFAVPAEAAPVSAGADELPHRLDSLEQRVAALAAAAAVPTPAVSSESPTADAARAPALLVDAEARRRLEVLEQTVARWSQGARTNAPASDQAAEAAAAPPKPTLAELQHAVVAATAEADKIAAWQKLRFESNAYDDAAVATIVQLGLSSKDPAIRADVWRQADGRSTHPALAPALVQALQVDGEARVREEAAETLVKYLDVPGVREALTAASSGDADEKVRRQASRTLAPRDR